MSVETDLYKNLKDLITKYHPSRDFSMLDNAFNLSLNAHEGQLRKSGEPYIIHPLKVGIILAEL
ncbi:MAG: hypothetical protein ACRCW1_09970, partial [Anaerotignaceae bacterium]